MREIDAPVPHPGCRGIRSGWIVDGRVIPKREESCQTADLARRWSLDDVQDGRGAVHMHAGLISGLAQRHHARLRGEGERALTPSRWCGVKYPHVRHNVTSRPENSGRGGAQGQQHLEHKLGDEPNPHRRCRYPTDKDAAGHPRRTNSPPGRALRVSSPMDQTGPSTSTLITALLS
jgi:hypothetical protein